MMRIAVLYGGRSGEHEVSLQSAASVVRNLDADRFSILLIGISKGGVWYRQPAAVLQQALRGDDPLTIQRGDRAVVDVRPGIGLVCSGEQIETDVVFPVLHGSFGEDGTVQGALELAGLPYVGAGVLGSAAGMDKDAAKRLWRASGIPVVPSLTVRRREVSSETTGSRYELHPSNVQSLFDRACTRFGTPLFVKPARAGSSVGVTRVESSQEFNAALADALRYDTKVLIEPAIDGQEIEVSVVGNDQARAFPPGEVVPTHRFYDYVAKYQDPNGATLRIPAALSHDEADAITRIAAAAHESVCAEGMSRVDFFISHADRTIYVNEINTIPGFTRISMFPRMCAAAGVAYPQLLTMLIELALERFEEQKGIVFDYQCS